ncbi:hypothetical protein L2E82_06268 [Cichorium intybus]|uniref:Uncharacterized protein n=1 Tax=Cichorium intybus TaxID=13427 RepID=A0ACB9HAP3_CICIN|nr:hypothetical protein L2E82_06268 [Cichorium intybus]
MPNSMNSRSVRPPSPSSPIFFQTILLIKADRETYKRRAAKGGERCPHVEFTPHVITVKAGEVPSSGRPSHQG